jgi:hypothetical protein
MTAEEDSVWGEEVGKGWRESPEDRDTAKGEGKA